MASRPVAGTRYSTGAIVLHWLIALLIIANVGIVWSAHNLVGKAGHRPLMAVHKEIGISVLALSALRIAWRLTHRPPPFVPTLRGWERALASTLHGLFYVLIIAIPLTGWMMISASGIKTIDYFGLFTIPPLPVTAPGAHETLEGVHGNLGWLIAILLCLHVAAALKHQFVDRDGTLGRMLPWLART